MSMKLGASSGTYNVRASELARESKIVKTIKCNVHFLDGTEGSFQLDKRSRGQYLFDLVCEHLEIIEKGYFGLQFIDTSQTSDTVRWLDNSKLIKKQMKANPPYKYLFRVKFYISDPTKLAEEFTRYQFFLQLKTDIKNGKLAASYKTAVLLASYAIQGEHGDYDSKDDSSMSYISSNKFIPNQTAQYEKEVHELHKRHRGLTPAKAELFYLDCARRLEMYGIDVFKAYWDQNNIDIELGVSSAGLVVFQNQVRINTFSWAKIVKISFKRKQFFIQLRRETVSLENENIDNLIGFNLVSYRSCKNLWKSCVEHHTFFRLHAPQQPVKKSFFSLGSNFRFSGRTEFQTLEEVKKRPRVERAFSRSPSRNFARRTVGGTTRQVILEERNSIDGLRNQPQNSVDSQDNSFKPDLSHYPSSTDNALSNSTSYPNSLLYQKSNPPSSQFNNNDNLLHCPSSDNDCHTLTKSPAHTSALIEKSPQKRWGDCYNTENSSNSNLIGFSEDNPGPGSAHINPHNELSPLESYQNNGSFYPEGPSLVTIKMQPDNEGRFGFNVKGGADQGMPIIVSRVAPKTPADLCTPRLNEGDQVLYINNRDVSQHTHEQIVMYIRASAEKHSRELVLVVRPNVYIGEDTGEDNEIHYIPDPKQLNNKLPADTDPLTGSIMLLEQLLQSGTALTEFDQLYRKKPGMTMNVSKTSDNIPKNRYRDISPYDQTRVIIKSRTTEDYINANYVNMEIPGSGIVNCYIAAQGPLPNTCADFWQMVWQQQCRLVVMLTTKVERGRVKCHQYWPQLKEAVKFENLQITCTKEELTSSFAFREFTLLNEEENTVQRHIQQMQYTSWPDHGVPDDSTDFLDFVAKVRQNRIGMVEPTVVHCSAGIGRTGVLITMETAMCLIEANQPVYPLDIVRQMRDQRAMLIQTSMQYKFVCEAILEVFKDRIVQPMDDYTR